MEQTRIYAIKKEVLHMIMYVMYARVALYARGKVSVPRFSNV